MIRGKRGRRGGEEEKGVIMKKKTLWLLLLLLLSLWVLLPMSCGSYFAHTLNVKMGN